VLDVLSSTPPRPSGRKHRWARHLAVLATKADEKRGLSLLRSNRRNTVIGPTAARSRNLRCAPIPRGLVRSWSLRGRRGGFAAPAAAATGLCCGPRYAAIWRSQATAISRRLAALATRPSATAPRRLKAPGARRDPVSVTQNSKLRTQNSAGGLAGVSRDTPRWPRRRGAMRPGRPTACAHRRVRAVDPRGLQTSDRW